MIRKTDSNFIEGKIVCMEIFCKKWKDLAIRKIINYEKKEMIPLTDEEKKSYEKQKVRKNFFMIKMRKINLNYTKKSRIIVLLQENLEDLLIVFAVQDTKYLKKFL